MSQEIPIILTTENYELLNFGHLNFWTLNSAQKIGISGNFGQIFVVYINAIKLETNPIT